MCFFLGNDFLPHFPAINIRGNGISILTSAYKETVSLDGNLTSETGIRWRGIRAFVKRLAAIERETIIKEGENRDKQSKHTYPPKKGVSREEIALEAIPLNDRGVENYINASEDGWRERYYDVLFDCDASDERIREICINYAEGLEWTLNYYSGSCIDWEWCYKYHYPPLLSDLLNYLPYFDCDILTKKPKSPLPSLVQLGYVLPGQCLSILPSKVHRVLIENHPEWYVSDVKLQWAFCRYLWEAHAELPQIDIGELRKLIETVM